MAKIVTIRMVVEDDLVDDLVADAMERNAQVDEIIDSMVEVHPLPEFIADSIVNETYEPGDFNKPLHVGTTLTDLHGKVTNWWNCMDDNETLIVYKYDNVGELTDAAILRFAE